MHVAYLTPQYPKVSHTFVRREIHELERRGHRILRLSIRRPEAEVVDAADRAERERTLVVLAQPPGRLAAAFARVALTRPGRLLRALALSLRQGLAGGAGLVRHLAYLVEATFVLERLRAEGVEHVHVHFGTNAASVARLLRRLGGPPYSITVHGPDELDAPAAHALGAKIEESAFTIAISDFTAAQLRRWVAPEQWSKLRVVRCTVDERFFEAAEPVRDDAHGLVCVGRLSAQKGQLVLLDAFAELLRKRPDLEGARLVLAGDGEMRAQVEGRIAALGLAERVAITGWIDEARVREELRRARCLVLPSFAEGLPVVLMEALAMARPVISTWVAGIPELVVPGESGWLVPPANPVALAEAMAAALDAPAEQLHRMARAGARRVRERHAVATEGELLEALLRGAAG